MTMVSGCAMCVSCVCVRPGGQSCEGGRPTRGDAGLCYHVSGPCAVDSGQKWNRRVARGERRKSGLRFPPFLCPPLTLHRQLLIGAEVEFRGTLAAEGVVDELAEA